MDKIIIPSAKAVKNEILNLGKVPAIIYPINEEIVFDYILRQYNDNMPINIVCYEEKEKVIERLDKYLNEDIKIIELKQLKDLGYSIHSAITNEDQEIVINFGDTIIYEKLNLNEKDFFFYSNDYKSGKWTFFEEKDGKLINIEDKKEVLEKEVLKKGKIFVGVFKISNAQYFKKCLEKVMFVQNGIDSFYNALKLYSNKYNLKAIKTNNWYDVGHLDRYYNSKLEVKSREFNHIKIDKDRGILTKTSDNIEKFIGEIKWYLKLPMELEYVRPRIFSYDLSYENPSVSMEYYAYHTIHELYLNGNLNYLQWVDIFKRIKFILKDFKRYKVVDEKQIKKSLKDMYLNKTENRLNKIKLNDKFSMFFEKNIVINGIEYKNLNEIFNILEEKIPSLFNINEFNIIHGDLCFANIMIDPNLTFIKVIDPRGKFGKFDIYGDQRYEFAKLFHSFDGGYDFIIKDLFQISINQCNDKIVIDYHINNIKNIDVYGIFKEIFKEELRNQIKEVEFIESLLFLSMIPLHSENVNHQYAMLATGIQILDRIVNVKKEK